MKFNELSDHMEESNAMLSFVQVSLVALGEKDYPVDENDKQGLFLILSHIGERFKEANKCVDENYGYVNQALKLCEAQKAA